MCLMFVPKMKLIGPMVFEELAIGQTNKQTHRVPYAINKIDVFYNQKIYFSKKTTKMNQLKM